MEVVSYFSLKYEEDIHASFNITVIVESIDFILKNNICVFGNEYFLQLQCTTMGIMFTPTFASLSMVYYEIKLYNLIEPNYHLNIRQYFLENWKVFLDNCEIRLKADLMKLDDL